MSLRQDRWIMSQETGITRAHNVWVEEFSQSHIDKYYRKFSTDTEETNLIFIKMLLTVRKLNLFITDPNNNKR